MSDCDNPLLTTLLDVLPLSVLVLDAHGMIQMSSVTACTLTGRTMEELNHLPVVELAHFDDRAAIHAVVQSCLESGSATTLEFRLVQPRGQSTPMRWTLHPCPANAGADGWLILTPEVQNLPEQRREFLSNAGHELRNPLSSILAFAEAVQEGVHGPVNVAQAASLQAIRESVQRQLELINQFVELGHLEAHAVRLAHASCRLTDIVDSALAVVKEVARSRSIQILKQVTPGDASVNADSKRLGQIVTEMLAIGVISCPVGSELNLELEAGSGSVLEILLQGGPASTGFILAREPLALSEYALKSISRVRRLRPIGLALLEELVKLHQGTFSFQASADGGMGIWIQLCLNLNSATTTARAKTTPLIRRAPKTEPLSSPATLSANSPLVLLADDQPALSSITRDYLESIGLRVEVAFDGQEAVNKTFQLRPDLIMMDVQMPVMDGLEAIRRIRQCSEAKLAQVPIISLSGLAVSGDMEKCLSAGATSYLAKPFGVQQLHRAIRDFITMP